MASNNRIELLGCPFDRLTMESALGQCLEWCQPPRVSHTVVTMNAALLCAMRRDSKLRQACLRGDLIVADGVPVVWTSRLAGVPLPARVAGVDLMAGLLATGSAQHLRAYFLGARAEVIGTLVRRCRQEHPGLIVAGFRHGYFGADEHARVVAEIRDCVPDLLFVGMPSPFKETWCEEHREALNVPVIMGVGGSFDVLAGYVRRAPRLLQSLALEWSWRLAMEPRRMWRRYLVTNSQYLWLAAGEILRRRVLLSSRRD